MGRMLSWLVFDLQALIYGVFRPQRPTAVVASSPSMLSLVVGLCLAKFYRCALVLEVRDIWPLTAIEEYGYRRGSLVVKIAAFVERFTMSSADAVVGFGENFCQHYSSVTGRREGCFSIGQGVSAPSIPPFTPVRRAGRMRVGYFGSLGASNFLDPLIDAARQLERNDEIEFVVYGQGEKASQYQEASSGLTNIRFYGAISKAEAREKMQECHVLFASMIPSQLSLLGQSLTKIVDYLSAGRAIVFAYDGPRKMLEESGAVWIVDPQNPLEIADTLSKIATVSESELNSIGKSGYDWCLRSCDYRAIADSYEEVLSSVAEARSMKKGA